MKEEPVSWIDSFLKSQRRIIPVVTAVLGVMLLVTAIFFGHRFESYEIDRKAVDDLLESGIPDELIKDLTPVVDRKYTGRTEYEEVLRLTLGEEKLERYREVLLDTAKKGSPTRVALGLGGLYCLGVAWALRRRQRERRGDQWEEFDTKRRESEQLARREEALRKNLFESNLGSVIVLQRLSMRNLRFFDDLDWKIHPQINILLGRNGYGKSHLLQGLVSLLQWDKVNAKKFFEHECADAEARVRITKDGEEQAIWWQDRLFEDYVGKVPVLSIPDSRFINRSRQAIGVGLDAHLDPKSNGSYHFLNDLPYDAVIENLLHAMATQYVAKRRRFSVPIFELARRVIRDLTDESFDFAEVDSHVTRGAYTIKVFTEGNEDTPLPIQAASQGTLSVLAMFGLIYYFLLSIYPDTREKRLREKPAIVVIDELDAHLHPAWQRQIVSLLRREFPRVQFILTAHSPLVVAGCVAGEVSVMRKNKESGHFELVVQQHDYIGWTADEIYREVFGVEGFDDAYYEYISLGPEEETMRREYERLANFEEDLKEADKTKLLELGRNLRRLGELQRRQDRMLENEELARVNERLRMELERLREGLSE